MSTALPVVPDSTAEILRATHLAVVRVDQVSLGEPKPAGDFLEERTGTVRVTLVRLPKGETREPLGQQVELSVTRHENTGARFTALPGVWSRTSLETGQEYLLFSSAGRSPLEILFGEPQLFLVCPAAESEPDVQAALLAAAAGPKLVDGLARVADRRRSLGALFARYAAWRLREPLLARLPSEFGAACDFLEHADTSPVFRRVVLTEAIDLCMLFEPVPDPFLARVVLCALRLSSSGEDAEALRGPIVQTSLPNLLGLVGGIARRDAAQVFATTPDARRECTERCAGLEHSTGREAILRWLRS